MVFRRHLFNLITDEMEYRQQASTYPFSHTSGSLLWLSSQLEAVGKKVFGVLILDF